MKKYILLTSLLISCFLITAQSTAKQTPKSKLSAKDSLMCGKAWKIVSIEEFGVINKPTEKTQNDMLLLNLDGSFNLILFGNKKSGNWTKTGPYIYFTEGTSKEKFNYKVVSIEKQKLKFDYRDPDETHSLFEMENK